MNFQLYKLILCSTFGKNSQKPLKAALYRFLIALLVSSFFGLICTKALVSSHMPRDLPSIWTQAFIGFISYSLMGFIMFVLRTPFENHREGINKQIITWPLSKLNYFTYKTLPYLLIWLILMTFVIFAEIGLSKSMETSYWLLISSTSFYSLSALAICLSSYPKTNLSKASILLLSSLSCGLLLKYSIEKNIISLSLIVSAILTSQLLSILKIKEICNIYQKNKFNKLNVTKYSNIGIANKLQWFVLKIYRNSRTRGSVLFCISLSAVMSILIFKNNYINNSEGLGWLVFGVILASVFACDVRGISRRYKAPEISAPSSVSNFIRSEASAAIYISMLIGLPIFIVVVLSNVVPFLTCLFLYIAFQISGALIGLLCSTLLVPQDGDISGQFFSSILAISVIIFFPKMTRLNNYSFSVQALGWISYSVLALYFIYLIEEKRRNNYGFN